MELYTHLVASDPDADVRMQACYLLGTIASSGSRLVPADTAVTFDAIIEVLLQRVGGEKDGLALSMPLTFTLRGV